MTVYYLIVVLIKLFKKKFLVIQGKIQYWGKSLQLVSFYKGGSVESGRVLLSFYVSFVSVVTFGRGSIGETTIPLRTCTIWNLESPSVVTQVVILRFLCNYFFQKAKQKTVIGQMLDMTTTDLSQFTWSRYSSIVKHKTR